jgi:hypothetical protein
VRVTVSEMGSGNPDLIANIEVAAFTVIPGLEVTSETRPPGSRLESPFLRSGSPTRVAADDR